MHTEQPTSPTHAHTGAASPQRPQPFIFVTGGCRSGKSGYAQAVAEALAPRGLYLATAEARDAEMRARIEAHRQARGPHWRVLESLPAKAAELYRELPCAIGPGEVLLFDCLTLWVSGCMECRLDETAMQGAFRELANALFRLPCPVVVVSNEVGLGLVPETASGRRFRDLAGLANQYMASFATAVVFVVSGYPLAVKGVLPAREFQPSCAT